jgi:hypothetical protein
VIRTLTVFLLLLATASSAEEALEASSESGPVQVRVRLTPAQPVIGDPIHFEIEARAEAGVELLMPAFGEALDRFRVAAFAPSEEVGEDGGTIARQRYTLHSARSGDQSMPPLLVEFVDRRPGRDPAPEGADAYEVLTERIDFRVSSVLPESAPTELLPALGALPPRRVPMGPWWVWALGAFAVLAALAPLALRVLRERLARERRRSAYEIARAELDALLSGARPGPREVDAFFVKLSFVVRRYLEDRFGLRSPELTTEEFLDELSRSPDLYQSHRDLLGEFLRGADLVKFAGHVPDADAVEAAIDAATHFLEETREVAHA